LNDKCKFPRHFLPDGVPQLIPVKGVELRGCIPSGQQTKERKGSSNTVKWKGGRHDSIFEGCNVGCFGDAGFRALSLGSTGLRI
jgi:hypothetical protein